MSGGAGGAGWVAMSVALLLTLVGLVGCGSVVGEIRGHLDRGDYQAARSDAERYLREAGDSPERAKVIRLFAEADLRAAEHQGPEALRAFVAAHAGDPLLPEARTALDRQVFERGARVDDTPDAYRTYLAEFPEGVYSAEARDRIAELSLFRARDEGTTEALRAFVREYPESKYAAEARKLELALAWKHAERDGTPEAFDDLVRLYEGSLHSEALVSQARARAAEVRAKLEDPQWREATAANRVDAWLAFADRFPASARAATARERAYDLLAVAVERPDDSESWRTLRLRFPDSELAKQAYPKEVARAWEAAQAAHTIAAYDEFAAAYPEHATSLVAARRAADLRWFQATPQEALRADINQSRVRHDGSIQLLVQARRAADDGLVGGLPRESFEVYEDGLAAPLAEFLGMESPRPIDVVFVMDTSGSMNDEIEAVKQSALDFAEILRFRQRDVHFGLVTFVEEVEEQFGGRKLTASANTFREWVASIAGGRGSVENPMRAIDAALRYTFRDNAQKVLVLVTDEAPGLPYDRVSTLTLPAAADRLLDEDVLTYLIVPKLSVYEDMERRSRGALFDIDATKARGGFRALMLRLADLLSRQYVLVYREPRVRRPGTARNVRIRVAKPKVWAAVGRADIGAVAALVESGSGACDLGAIGVDGRAWVSEDCGVNWRQVASIEGLTEGDRVLDACSIGGPDGSIFARTERGLLWRLSLRGGRAELVAGIPDALGMAPSVGNRGLLVRTRHGLWAIGADGEVSKPTVGPWEGFTIRDFRRGVAVTSDGRLREGEGICVLAADGKIYCQDETRAWHVVGRPPWADAHLAEGARFGFVPWSPNVVFIGAPGHGLYRSQDGGQNWVLVPLPTADASQLGAIGPTYFGDGPGRWICQVAGQNIYCSDDDGLSWHRDDTNLALSEAARPLLIARAGGDRLAIGSSGGSVFGEFDVEDREFVSAQVYFASGSAEPKPGLSPFLHKIAAAVAADPSLSVSVEGHTDSDGPDAYNLELSRRRAERVGELLSTSGCPRARLTAEGHGETRPLFPNTSEANKRRNRRVEILTMRPSTIHGRGVGAH